MITVVDNGSTDGSIAEITTKFPRLRFLPLGVNRGFTGGIAAALLTFPQSIETDLSMRTRVYDYLWGGLPIVTSSAPGTDEILEKYDAGRIVHGEEPRDYANALIEAMRADLRQNTQKFVSDHQWPRTLAPLLEFCNAPAIDKTKETFAVRLQAQAPPASILDRIKRRIGGRA